METLFWWLGAIGIGATMLCVVHIITDHLDDPDDHDDWSDR